MTPQSLLARYLASAWLGVFLAVYSVYKYAERSSEMDPEIDLQTERQRR